MTQPEDHEQRIETRPTAFHQDDRDGLSQEALFEDLADAMTALGMWLCVARRLAQSPQAQDSLGPGNVLTKAADQHRRASEAVRLLRDRIDQQGMRLPEPARSMPNRRDGFRGTHGAIRGKPSVPMPNTTFTGESAV